MTFPTYPKGFPDRIVIPFQKAIGRTVLGNKTASGTEIIKELGEEHVRTGRPILYTSADSVFQIAAHEGVIPLEALYRICRIAREMLDGEDRVGRIIARPFVGKSGNFARTGTARFRNPASGQTLLDHLRIPALQRWGSENSINFRFQDSTNTSSHDNVNHWIGPSTLGHSPEGLIFANLVDFDMLWGHRRVQVCTSIRRSTAGFPTSNRLCGGTLLIITADHGCDQRTRGATIPGICAILVPQGLGGSEPGNAVCAADMVKPLPKVLD
jgi:phosphopentomutase